VVTFAVLFCALFFLEAMLVVEVSVPRLQDIPRREWWSGAELIGCRVLS
jgi:hypothetical protein